MWSRRSTPIQSGNASCAVTIEEVAGPLSVTTTVKFTVAPPTGYALSTVFTMAMSAVLPPPPPFVATGIDTLELLLLKFGSVNRMTFIRPTRCGVLDQRFLQCLRPPLR